MIVNLLKTASVSLKHSHKSSHEIVCQTMMNTIILNFTCNFTKLLLKCHLGQ